MPVSDQPRADAPLASLPQAGLSTAPSVRKPSVRRNSTKSGGGLFGPPNAGLAIVAATSASVSSCIHKMQVDLGANRNCCDVQVRNLREYVIDESLESINHLTNPAEEPREAENRNRITHGVRRYSLRFILYRITSSFRQRSVSSSRSQ